MERLLTPLVTRLLERFVKRSQEGDAGKFKVALSGSGGFSLHNLELDLGSVLPADLLESRRAFARSLQIKVPWTALNTQPIEVIFDTVEIVLGDSTQQNRSSSQDGQSEDTESSTTNNNISGGTRGGGWLGLGGRSSSWLTSNLQSMALRAGLNLSFTIKNLVIKYVCINDFVMTIALEQLIIANRESIEWWDLVETPEAWLMKNCLIKGLSISIDNTESSSLQTYLPLLRLSSLSIAALLPIFSYIEEMDLGKDDAKVAVEVQLGSVLGAVNDQQIKWMYVLIEKLRIISSNNGIEELEGEDGVEVPVSSDGEGATFGMDQGTEEQPQMKALGFLGKIWNVAVDEASYIRNIETSELLQEEGNRGRGGNTVPVITDVNQQSEDFGNRHPPTQAELTLTLSTLCVQLGIANNQNASFISSSSSTTTASLKTTEVVLGPSVVPFLDFEFGLTQVCTASINTTLLDVEMQVQNISVRHNSCVVSGGAIVQLLSSSQCNGNGGGDGGGNHSASSVAAEEEPVWDEIFSIHPCEVPLRSAGRLRNPENALEFQKTVVDNLDHNGGPANVDETACSLHVGQVWIAVDPMLRHHAELFIARLVLINKSAGAAEGAAPPSALDEESSIKDSGVEREDILPSSQPLMWSSISGWDIEIDALQVALRCLMKKYIIDTTYTDSTSTSTSVTSAALLIQATEAISYHTRDTANAFRPQGFQCPLILSVVHGWWQPMCQKTGQHTVAMPGAVMLSKAFTLSGSLRQDHSIQGPFFSISPLVLDGSGEEIAAALSCILAAVAGTTTEPRDPLPLLSGWAGRAQLSLKQGLRLNKDLKSDSGDYKTNEERAWDVFASSLSLVLTSRSPRNAATVATADTSDSPGKIEEVYASLDLTTLQCYASPGLKISMDLICLGVEIHSQEKEEDEEDAHEPLPPLAVVTSFQMRSEENVQEYTFGCLNIMGDPSTIHAAMALAAGFNNKNNTATNPAPALVSREAEKSSLSASEDQTTTIYGFDMITFTLFPPTTDLQKTLANTSAAAAAVPLLGVTGWLSRFSMEVGPSSRQVSLNCLEFLQCKIDSGGNETIKLPRIKVFSFDRNTSSLVFQASSSVISSATRQPQEQFTIEVAPLKAHLTPELLSTLNAFLPPENPTNNTVITEVLVIEPNSTISTPLLHGNITLGSFSLELAQEVEWAGEQGQSDCANNSPKPLFKVFFEEALVSICQEMASERCPWLYGTSATALTASASLLGLGARVEKHAGGTGSDCTQILLPADIKALIHQWSPTRSLVVALEADTLDFKVSKNVADAATSLTNAYSNSDSPEAVEAELAHNALVIDVLSDDLRSGASVFTETDSPMTGCQPLRVAVRSPGGHGKESLEWRYAYPRSIGCVFILGVEPSDFPAPLSLSRLDETTGAFTNVELWPKIIQGAQFGGTGFFIAEGAQDAAAHFWRLCWTSPADSSDANSLINRIYVNPQGQELWNAAVEDAPGRQKSPLVAPFSFGFSLNHFDVSLLAAHSASSDAKKTNLIPSVHVLNVLAVLHAENFLLSMHKWNTSNREAVAIDATMTACVEYTEATTLCSATLIKPFDVILSFENASSNSQVVDEQPQQDGGGPLSILRGVNNAAGGLAAMQEDAMVFAARRQPEASGFYVKCNFITPLVVIISELAIYDLQRLVALATTAPANDATTMSPIKIFNETSHTVAFQQYGVPASVTLLKPGTSSGFNWAATPRMQGPQFGLQFALATSGNLVPSLPSWSNHIDVMTAGGASLTVPGSEYNSAKVAVMVERDECTWHVHLKHGLRIYNRQDLKLKVLVMNPNGPQIVEIEPRKSQDIPLLSAGVGGVGSPVRLWLGTSWSREFYSHRDNDLIKVLEADLSFQFDVVGPDSAMAAAPLVVQFAGTDACTGHVVVAIWPPLKLSNELPQSITIEFPQRLVRDDNKIVSLGPSETLSMPVDINGGEIAKITTGFAVEGNPSAPPVALFCPPLKGTENDSPLTKGISAAAPSDNAIYILSPGNAAQFHIPSSQGIAKSMPCFLLTDANDVSPGLSLKLIPQWKLVNNLSIPVDLELRGSRTISIPSNRATLDDLRASSVRQITLSVMYEKTKYSSKGFLFDLENPIEQQLSLLPLQVAYNIRAPLRVGLELKLTTVGEYKAFELTVSPSYYLENISSLALIIREPSILGAEVKEPELLLPPQCSLPLLAVPEHLEVALAENIQERKQAWNGFSLDKATQDGCIFLDRGGKRYTLSYEVVLEPTSHRLIFFKDSDPPVYLQNNSSSSLDLSWTSGDDQLAAVLPPDQMLEFTVDTENAAGDAWDDSGLATDLRAYRTTIGASILLKSHGEEEWQELLLEEGEQRCGLFTVRRQRRGAGIALIVENEEVSAKQIIKTLNVSVHVEQLCVLMQDDERGRITGVNEARPTVAVAFNRLDLSVSKALGPPSEAIVSTLRFEELRCSTCFPVQQSLLWSADSTFSASAEMVITTLDGDRSISITDASLELPPLFLNIDDSSFELYVQYKALLEKPTGFQKAIAIQAQPVRQDEAKLKLCSKRVHVNNLQIGQLNAIADIHLTPARTGLPVAVDTDRSPLSISKISIHNISAPLHLLLQGLTKHIVAEALLNAPLVLGSLQLFFNPTGLVRSIQRGVANMIDLPLQGLQHGPLQFIAGVGQGSVSLVKEISEWSLSSVVGFSRAASNALVGSFARSSIGGLSPAPSSELESLPQTKTALVYGFVSLADQLGLNLHDSIGEILLVSVASDTVIQQSEQAVFKLSQPVVIFATNAIILYSDNGRTPSLLAWLNEASISTSEGSLQICSSRAAPISDLGSACAARITTKFHQSAWAKIAPSVRRLFQT
ncbi:hypothetical protein Ndes2526A_g01019 [Nannochloris sp. 'desiccata']